MVRRSGAVQPQNTLLLALNHEKNPRTNEHHSDHPAKVNRLVKQKTADEQCPDVGNAYHWECYADVKFRKDLQPKNCAYSV